jgi:hypothetical protein
LIGARFEIPLTPTGPTITASLETPEAAAVLLGWILDPPIEAEGDVPEIPPWKCLRALSPEKGRSVRAKGAFEPLGSSPSPRPQPTTGFVGLPYAGTRNGDGTGAGALAEGRRRATPDGGGLTHRPTSPPGGNVASPPRNFI